MSNAAYLCGTDERKIYPSFWNKAYSAQERTVAVCSNSIPLFWLLLFNGHDLQEMSFEVKGVRVNAYAPIAEKTQALMSLDRNYQILIEKLNCSDLSSYHRLFRAEIEMASAKYFTIELEELDRMEEAGVFKRRLQLFYQRIQEGKLISAFKKWNEVKHADLAELAFRLSRYYPEMNPPPADLFVVKGKASDQEMTGINALLGWSHYKPTTWLPGPKP